MHIVKWRDFKLKNKNIEHTSIRHNNKQFILLQQSRSGDNYAIIKKSIIFFQQYNILCLKNTADRRLFFKFVFVCRMSHALLVPNKNFIFKLIFL